MSTTHTSPYAPRARWALVRAEDAGWGSADILTTPGAGWLLLELGTFESFVALWATMMLPGAAPAISRHAHGGGRERAVPRFVGPYLAVWTPVGVAVYALHRSHGTFTAGALARGIYEFTPQSGTSAGSAARASTLDSITALACRLEHRTDADAGGNGRHERQPDVRDRRPRRPEAPAPRAAIDVPVG